jgi:hypothetical protein
MSRAGFNATERVGTKAEMTQALKQIASLALRANEEYESSCRHKVGEIRSIAKKALGPEGDWL